MDYKKLFVEQSHHFEKLKKEFARVVREQEDLESLISWMNEKCMREHKQICGIRRLNYPNGSLMCYIGFILECTSSHEPQHYYNYTINGYLSDDKCRKRVYTAHVSQKFKDIPLTESTLQLISNSVLYDPIKRKGVGTAGLSMVKELAKDLHCTKIEGQKMPIPDTPEELSKLTAFYAANGFEQDDDRKITFNMANYNRGEEK